MPCEFKTFRYTCGKEACLVGEHINFGPCSLHIGIHGKAPDVSDIGDDHSDPFLIKMVTLGFIEHGASGFYDDKGNALEGAHHH
ncbi:MAG: hypothetical protein ACJA13_002205 [Paraglaciecola sp.]|jgi:hypothetical protein